MPACLLLWQVVLLQVLLVLMVPMLLVRLHLRCCMLCVCLHGHVLPLALALPFALQSSLSMQHGCS